MNKIVNRLNLGAGDIPLDGYENIDIKDDKKAFPLDYPDESVEEIRASHILEHFPSRQVPEVLDEWKRVLKPGGVLKVAVPNFELIAKLYLHPSKGKYPLEGWCMGGQIDDHDYHQAIFDKGKLQAQLRESGFVRVEPWESDANDCASLDISLNLMATKPTEEQDKVPNIQAVMSVPRLGFMDNFFCVTKLAGMGIPVRKFTGAFWGQCLERSIEMAVDDGADIILVVDYDTVFDESHVRDLLYAVRSYPEYDAFAPMQVSRGNDQLLMCNLDENGHVVASHSAKPYYDLDAVPVDSANFGLTAIRADILRKMPHPWFNGEPSPDGKWGEGRVDDDIWFWRVLKRAGGTLAVCPRVSVGHMELMVRWPGPTTEAIYQTVGEYHDKGAPAEVWQ